MNLRRSPPRPPRLTVVLGGAASDGPEGTLGDPPPDVVSALGLPDSRGGSVRLQPRVVAHGRPVADITYGASDSEDDTGTDTSESAPTETTASELVAQILPTATSLVAASSSQDPAIIKAKIKNYKRMRNAARYGGVLWRIYDNRMRVLQGKLKASQKKSAREEELNQSRRQWSMLGKTGVVIGIGVGTALIALLVSASTRQRRLAQAVR